MAEDSDGHVTFQTLSDGVDLRFAETNSEWEIIATSAEIFTNRPGLEQLNYKLTLKRHLYHYHNSKMFFQPPYSLL
jgi:hypothetical protein